MQLQMQDILNFSAFYDAVKSQKLGIKTAYKLSRLNKAIETEMQFYREKLQAIITEFGLFDENGMIVSVENGKGIKLRPGVETECFTATQELQLLEITLPDINFSFEEFENVELTVEEMNAAMPFWTE
jgi:hypothetical protein